MADGWERTKNALKAKIRCLEKEPKSAQDLGAAGLGTGHTIVWETWEVNPTFAEILTDKPKQTNPNKRNPKPQAVNHKP